MTEWNPTAEKSLTPPLVSIEGARLVRASEPDWNKPFTPEEVRNLMRRDFFPPHLQALMNQARKKESED